MNTEALNIDAKEGKAVKRAKLVATVSLAFGVLMTLCFSYLIWNFQGYYKLYLMGGSDQALEHIPSTSDQITLQIDSMTRLNVNDKTHDTNRKGRRTSADYVVGWYYLAEAKGKSFIVKTKPEEYEGQNPTNIEVKGVISPIKLDSALVSFINGDSNVKDIYENLTSDGPFRVQNLNMQNAIISTQDYMQNKGKGFYGIMLLPLLWLFGIWTIRNNTRFLKNPKISPVYKKYIEKNKS